MGSRRISRWTGGPPRRRLEAQPPGATAASLLPIVTHQSEIDAWVAELEEEGHGITGPLEIDYDDAAPGDSSIDLTDAPQGW